MTFVRLLIVLVAAQCAGCGGDVLRGSGVEVMPPQGYTLYCISNPTAKECGG